MQKKITNHRNENHCISANQFTFIKEIWVPNKIWVLEKNCFNGWLSFAALQNVFHKINKQKVLEIFCSTIYFGYVYIPRLVDNTNYRWISVTAVMGLSNQKEKDRFSNIVQLSPSHLLTPPLLSSTVSLTITGLCHSDFEFRQMSASHLFILTASFTCRVSGSLKDFTTFILYATSNGTVQL